MDPVRDLAVYQGVVEQKAYHAEAPVAAKNLVVYDRPLAVRDDRFVVVVRILVVAWVAAPGQVVGADDHRDL
jgi:hypothetical protein